MMWAPVQTVFLLWAAWAVSVWVLTWSEFILFSISIGFNTGVLGINIAHELIHKANSLEQWLGKILLVEVCYGHFFVEHIWGHHKRVSTPYDAATAQYGENFYSFWVKSVVGSFRSAWHIEALRLKKRGRNVWSIYNQMLRFIGLSALIAFSLYVTFGKNALIMFAIQSGKFSPKFPLNF
jgi:alkane 1-monooxygenase